jgi:lipopolysaccharide/colanic/teichoic acid biosynthesis glycosyltransferase/glycosyltransferase involved in cell wall biosynthesis
MKVPLVYILTTAGSADGFLKGQLTYMRERGWEVIVIAAQGDELRILRNREKVDTLAIPVKREISPLRDLVSLVRLYRVLRRLRPAIVNASTPKAGLLGMLAAYAAGVPVRIYTLRGLRLETVRGPKRVVLSAAEHCASALSHRVICVSESLRRLYLTLGFSTEAKAVVLGAGSSNGIKIEMDTPNSEVCRKVGLLREKLGIPEDAPVVGFVGRFTRDKGIPELLDAFDQLLATVPEARLLMLGGFEDGDPIPKGYVDRLCHHARVVMAGWVSDPSCYYLIMDVLAFPSHREGLPSVPLEAAAAQIPTVAFDATGSVDAVSDGVTGTLVPLGDVGSFTRALQRYLTDNLLRRQHGRAARERVLRDFRPETFWESLHEEYVRLLAGNNRMLFQKAAKWQANAPRCPAWQHPCDMPVPNSQPMLMISGATKESRAKKGSTIYSKFGKRFLDIAIAAPLLVLLIPVLVTVALLVRLKLGSPVLFLQQRPGHQCRPFMIYKFRTMTDARDANGRLLPDEERITPFGKALRRTSLDELPELFNVLKGHMSLVGPRPLLMKYLDRYTPEQNRRHNVLPGITGLAQVNGRNSLSWEHKFALDSWYVDHCSIWLDLKILAMTVGAVLRGEGVSAHSYVSAPEFMGTAKAPSDPPASRRSDS